MDEKANEPLSYQSVIFDAAVASNLERLRLLLANRSPHWLDVCLNQAKSGRSPLVSAARAGHFEVVKLLLELGADPRGVGDVDFDSESIRGAPALWAASAAGHFDIVRLLVEQYGAPVDQTTFTNSSPLRGACYDGHIEIVRYLLDHGANIELPNRHGHTPVMIAAYRKMSHIVNLLIERGADVNKTSEKRNTALHDAAEANDPLICGILLRAGARLEADDGGITPLLAAALLANHMSFKILYTACSDLQHAKDALLLFGATHIDKSPDTRVGVAFWRQALEITKAPTSCTRNGPINGRYQSPCERNGSFEKRSRDESDWTEVFGARRPFESLAELHAIEHDTELLQQHSAMTRERILGGAHPELHHYFIFRGTVMCDAGQLAQCIRLWNHVIRLQQSHLTPLSTGVMSSLAGYVEIFDEAIDDDMLLMNASPDLLDVSHILHVLNVALFELRRLAAWSGSPLTISDACCNRDHEHSVQAHSRQLLVVIFHLVMQVDRLLVAESARKNNSRNENEQFMFLQQSYPLPNKNQSQRNEDLRQRYQRALEETPALNLREVVELCAKIDLRPLHVALGEHRPPHHADGAPPPPSSSFNADRFPAHKVAEKLVAAGVDATALDDDGSTALHVLLKNERVRPREATIAMLLRMGVSLHIRNRHDETCLELLQKKHLDVKRTMPWNTIAGRMSLFGAAANVVRRQGLDEDEKVPRHLGAILKQY